MFTVLLKELHFIMVVTKRVAGGALLEVNRLFLVYLSILNLCLHDHRVTTLFSKPSLEVDVSGGR